MPTDRLSRFAWFVLAYNVAVVLFGAVVRATGSGAGCGSNWPTCRGGVVPLSGGAETAIEFTHRATSGLALVLVFVLAYRVVRSRPQGDPARWAAVAAAIFVLGEALIGAALVLFEWVADDESVGRVISIVIHLVNTFLLLGALALTAWFSAGRSVPSRPFHSTQWRLLRRGAALLMLVSAMGAITALGDTLFPKDALGAGFLDDLGGTLITRLRWIHPVLAVLTAVYLLWMIDRLRGAVSLAGAVEAMVYGQVVVGVVNVVLLAPIWMQVIHLLAADVLWIGFVLLAAQALADSRVPA